MTGSHSSDRSTAVPDAALVHLSGGRRGATEFIPGDRIVLSPASDGGIELSTSDETPPQSLAVLERRGHTFGLTVTPGAEVWINGERLDELVLASGDVLEFGGGAVLRYRLYPPERRRYKTMTEARIHSERCSRSHWPVRSRSMRRTWASFASTSSRQPFRRRKTSVAKKATRLLPSTKGWFMSSDSKSAAAIVTRSS